MTILPALLVISLVCSRLYYTPNKEIDCNTPRDPIPEKTSSVWTYRVRTGSRRASHDTAGIRRHQLGQRSLKTYLRLYHRSGGCLINDICRRNLETLR